MTRLLWKLSGNRILDAPETGEDVRCGILSELLGETSAIGRITEP